MDIDNSVHKSSKCFLLQCKFFKNIKIWPLSPQVAQEEGTREFKYVQLTVCTGYWIHFHVMWISSYLLYFWRLKYRQQLKEYSTAMCVCACTYAAIICNNIISVWQMPKYGNKQKTRRLQEMTSRLIELEYT